MAASIVFGKVRDRTVDAMRKVLGRCGLRQALEVRRPGLPESQREADRYLKIKAGARGGRARWIALNSPLRIAAMRQAGELAIHGDSYLGDSSRDLKQNLRRFGYVLAKFGLTYRERGATGHGLRHEVAQIEYQQIAGEPAPVCGGEPVSPELDLAARLHVARLAGHGRPVASRAYLGQSAVMRSKGRKPSDPPAS